MSPAPPFTAAAALLGVVCAAGCGSESSTTAPPASDDGGPVVPDHFVRVAGDADFEFLAGVEGEVTNLVVEPETYELLRAGLSGPNYRGIANAIFPQTPDVFDFIVLTFDPAAPGIPPPFGEHHRVSNDVQGLGFPIIDGGGLYGPTMQLAGMIMLHEPDDLRDGPSLHEIAHQWGATLLTEPEWFLHWGLTGVGGQLGGWVTGSLKRLDDGSWQGFAPNGRPFGLVANYGNQAPYAPLELYMMGLLPPDSVPDVEIAVQGDTVNTLEGIFRAASIDTLTIDEILFGFLPRDPAWPDAQSAFRLLYIVLSDAPLDEPTLGELRADARQFELQGSDGDQNLYNFWEATGGRGTVEIGFRPGEVEGVAGSG